MGIICEKLGEELEVTDDKTLFMYWENKIKLKRQTETPYASILSHNTYFNT